ncbi:tail fiber protein [Xenorhabdus bovienii]|uniref:tail fiber protein n=1 Tax=Xenorhabdus bovienii TaxID=40576 RepID=UPI0023B25C7D|nr:tail fiber protein [Xenorhabdus bovienii]MDE9481492.1 phage tail protein [Xenorhabdus bovienii]MDE9543359.1 phage tail protein [Xenorhabdus bovienii]MDE9550463.1 phage tail protein [Xenorhabdus bovienii]
MKEKRYSATVQEQPTLSDAKAVGSSIDQLKEKFKEGSIPLQTDFNTLIDIADIGRKACGQSPQQNGPGKGLKLDDSGTLSLKMGTISSQDFSPLILEKDILSVDLGSGLINNSNGISIGQGNGIVVNKNDVAVKLVANKGLIVDKNGISIKPGNGMKFSADGALAAKSADSTITVDGLGIRINLGYGVKVGNGLDVKTHANGGIGIGSDGISVKTGNGIKIDGDRVTIDPKTVLPKGMIMMFSGSSVPEGWALCDGNNGTPNLIDRFILGGKISDINSKNNVILSGSGNSKKCNKNSDNKVVSVNVKIKDTTLTLSQMPKHEHSGGMAYHNSTGFRNGYYKTDENSYQLDNRLENGYMSNNAFTPRSLISYDNKNPYYPYTSSKGDGKGHSHGADATANAHNHITDIIPPYYILAFIIKL